MKGWMPLATLCSSFFLILGCGSDTKTTRGFLPTTAFDALANEIPTWRACDHTQGYGCAFVRTLGNAVRGKYEFTNIYTKCTFEEDKVSVSIVNTIATQPTFSITIDLKSTTDETQICEGDTAGKCRLTLSLHKARAYSTVQSPCFVTTLSKNPLSAEITCNPLNSAAGAIEVAAGSQFTCQK